MTIKEALEVEEEMSQQTRDRLNKKAFGLPEDRKYPLNDENHIKSAISYFYKCKENKKKTLANNIYKACKKFNIEINKDADWYKYLI
jgi:hypothetical protein